jgi:N-acetylmuramoyl-L-alanine amidase
MRHYFVTLFLVVLLIIPWLAVNYPDEAKSILTTIENVGSQLATAVISHNPKTVSEIRSNYNSFQTSKTAKQRVRVLLVPGHEPNYGGAEFGVLKERDLNVELAKYLQQFIQVNGRFEVFVTRDTKSWNPLFADYFKNYWSDIVDWQKLHREEIVNMTRLGQYSVTTPTVFHNKAKDDIAFRLYGIGKWSNENNIDIVIHIHLNDYPRHKTSTTGDYSGFAIYIPDKQYFNSTTTKVLADAIFKRLEKYNAVSDLPGEKSGIVEDQDLIAVGSYNSVNAASMLIEYGYIYERQFVDSDLRSLAIKDLAFQTYLGLQDFLDPKNAINFAGSYDTLFLPYKWNDLALEDDFGSNDVFVLQTALLVGGHYPPTGRSMNDCPRTGTIGPCTRSALDSFQKKYGIDGEEGVVGPKTIKKLNELFRGGMI